MRPFRDMNPTLRGFLLIGLVALIIVIFQLEQTLLALSVLLQIAFLLAIAFFVYLVWRERRSEIGEWPKRPRAVFYGAALLILADIGAYWDHPPGRGDALAFFPVLGLCALSMWRRRRRQH